ncbi:hypothetical protein HERIO_1087 [Hepatospora eriocheir]|uniref:SUN domain-containing protein n=1 Tax=Hepatospora eriocheir TaxID=1081669 RepID=A0A1X0QBD9_9MICR|nr:hypothetical protein HERIO_1087 [Hepatospora eriocheir]
MKINFNNSSFKSTTKNENNKTEANNKSFTVDELLNGDLMDPITEDISISQETNNSLLSLRILNLLKLILKSVSFSFKLLLRQFTILNILLISIICYLTMFKSSKNEIFYNLKQNLASLNTVSRIETSNPFRYGMWSKKTKSKENMLLDNNDCASLVMNNNTFIEIALDEPKYLQSIALYHCVSGNVKSAIKNFTVTVLDKSINKERKFCFQFKNNGFQEFDLGCYAENIRVNILNNYGEEYVSIYRVYIYGS